MKKLSTFVAWFESNSFKIAMILTVIASIASLLFYYSKGLNFAYNDATSHLNIARRVVDSLTPGLVQIGSTWLPLLHILELPFIWNYFMWQSGLAGAIISMVGFILSSFFIFRSIEILIKDRISAFIGVLIVIANANMLYMQTTAMFEPLLIVTSLGTFYFLLKWADSNKITNLIIGAFFTMLGTLSRYDGWFFLIAAIIFVLIHSFNKNKKIKEAEGSTVLFATLAGFGIFLWLLYNLVIFGHPLYFAFNEYSAFSQQEALVSRGELPTKGNLALSFQVLGTAVILNQGIIFSALAIIGLILYLVKNHSKVRTWVAYLLLVPFVFNLIALYQGHSVIWIPNFPPYFDTFFNVRYGLLLLPAVVFFMSYLTRKNAVMKIVVILAIILQIALFYSLLPGRDNHLSFVTLRDTVASVNKPTQEATQWLFQNYDGGLILISSASSESFIFNSGLEIKNFITEGTGQYWKESLENPKKYATWVILFPSFTDRVGKALKENHILKEDYDIAFQNQTYVIFRKKDISALVVSDLKPIPRLWEIRSIDTMKTSRDQARYDLTDPELAERISKELQAIKNMGVNYVSIGTPYDKEFLPILKLWVNKAHELGLHVWFRGNFSSWEGWFGYPKNMTAAQHLIKTAEFIEDNQGLFLDGDSFTAAPEAENGGPWNPVKMANFNAYRSFLKEQYDICKTGFEKFGKQIYCNWFSMNADIANNVLDKETVNYVGNLITIDHYVGDKQRMKKNIESLHDKFGATILIGEFGAPIPEYNAEMTEEEQAEFVADVFWLLKEKNYILGVNYWTSKGGSTAIFNWDLSPKKVVGTITDFYKSAVLEGLVVNGQKDPMSNIKIQNKSISTNTDASGKFSLTLPAGKQTIEVIEDGKTIYSFSVILNRGKITKYNPMVISDKDKSRGIVNPEEYNILNQIIQF